MTPGRSDLSDLFLGFLIAFWVNARGDNIVASTEHRCHCHRAVVKTMRKKVPFFFLIVVT